MDCGSGPDGIQKTGTAGTKPQDTYLTYLNRWRCDQEGAREASNYRGGEKPLGIRIRSIETLTVDSAPASEVAYACLRLAGSAIGWWMGG